MTNDLELDLAADGQTVTLSVGQGLRLRLAETPTTGYQWSAASNDGLRLESSVFTPAGMAAGGGGTREFLWRARTPGLHPLTLSQRRVWEPVDKAIGRFAITVVIAGP